MSNSEVSFVPSTTLQEGLSEEIFSQIADARERLTADMPQILSATIAATDVPALEWLAAQNQHPKFFWQNRSGTVEIAGFGSAFSVSEQDPARFVERVEQVLAVCADHPQGHLFSFIGGSKFNPAEPQSVEWRDFPGLMFTLPEVVLIRDGAAQHFVITTQVDAKDSAAKIVRRIEREFAKLKAPKELTETFPKVGSRENLPARADWEKLCDTVIARLDAKPLAKLVLARRQTLELTAQPNCFEAIKQLQDDNPGSFAFLCAPSAGTSFVSVTPECLFRLNGDILEADALGGTAPRSGDPAKDKSAADELFASEKIAQEHHLVVVDVRNKLSPLSDSITADAKPQLVKYSHVQHLLTRFSGRKRKDVSAADILFALSPTSAVSGNPSELARSTIAELETFARGWYAGPIGIISQASVEFAVALRCMLAQEKHAVFFAGAGIVADSNSAQEWDEIENKTASTTRLFDAA